MKKVLYVLCALALTTGVVDAQRARAASGSVAVEDAADSLYRAGRAALNDRDYRRASSLFKQLVDKYPSSARAGDALYWRAWALYQLGNTNRSKPELDDALAALDRYNSNYAKNGTMASDVTELRGQIRTAQAKLGDADAAGDIAVAVGRLRQAHACNNADDEMRSAALQGLLSMNSQDAVPILKDVLKQRDPCREALRKQAVWMISQKQGADIVSTLLEVARNDPSSDVRQDAIFWLSQTRSAEAIPALDSILSSSRDEEIRKKAIFSLSQYRDERARQVLKRAAENESMSEELRGDAVFWLGQARVADLDYFKTLFRKTKNAEIRSKIVQAVSNSQSAEAGSWLLDIARDKSFDIETRKNALFWASQRRTFDFDQVSSIYDQTKGDEEMQKQVIFVLSQRREPAAVDKLMAIAKGDGDIEMRKQALFWLGQKNDPRIRQFIRDLINK
ncbi:MAG TPA: HEAT repeat domain-containing protein [Gemmatimonadaceae bacterium]|jgi:HEAT repeat protein|nr:HEAT repeat domain-containing protein [Gemmatimonadaceae bacterium]